MKPLTPTIWPRKPKRVTRLGAVVAVTFALGGERGLAQNNPPEPPPLTVHEGFEVVLAAAPPLIGYPMMACFDEKGRLYVAESDGRNLTTKGEIERELPRFVRRLVDTDGDGVFDQSTIFADKMTMPEGGLWHNGALYIISAPYLWRLEDTDDDGVADKREKILGYMEFDGRANQHGPFLGPNGRLYFTGGHFGYQFEGSDGSRTGKSRAAGVFSCRPDGGEVRIDGQGGINPVEIVFTRSGEMLSTCAIFDSFGGTRHDALIHWIPGGLTQRVYGVPLLPETGSRLPAVSRWGQVAPAGLARYRGTHFGADFKDTLFACHFNTNKVVHVRLVPHGATFLTEEQDFLTSSKRDFHPADILEDADGSLLLLDTGGWLSWGCPHSKTAKPEVKGAIYRIRRKGGEKVPDPRGLAMDWQTLKRFEISNLLADPRPAVRDRAQTHLLAMGAKAIPGVLSHLENNPNPDVRQRCVWIMSQIAAPDAPAFVRTALQDRNAGVRSAAARSVGERKDRASVPSLVELLEDISAPVRRSAATALGQIGDPSCLAPLIASLKPDSELVYQHAATRALIQIADADATVAYLRDAASPQHRQTALRVLDQIESALLIPSLVMPLLNSTHPGLRDEARRAIATRPEWRDEVLEVFTGLIAEDTPDDESAQLIEGIVLTLSEDQQFHEVIARTLTDRAVTAPVKVRLLNSIGFLETLPDPLHEVIRKALSDPSAVIGAEALAVVMRFEAGQIFAQEVNAIANNRAAAPGMRVAALETLSRSERSLDDGSFAFLSELVRNPKTPVLLGRQAARALGHLRLSPTSPRTAQLCDLISSAPPLQLTALLPPLEAPALNATNWSAEQLGTLGAQLAAALAKNPGRASVPSAQIEQLASAFPPDTQAAFRHLSANNASDAAQREAKLNSLLELAAAGNASRGRVLFHTNRATCSLCHRIEARGGSLGPNLSKIGGIRSRKDLLEAIVFPSATVVNGFESYVLTGKDGTSHTGLIQRETPEAIYLRNADQRLRRIPRQQIDSMLRSPVSAMPDGLDGVLSDQELADLVAFLETCR